MISPSKSDKNIPISVILNLTVTYSSIAGNNRILSNLHGDRDQRSIFRGSIRNPGTPAADGMILHETLNLDSKFSMY